MKNRATFHSGFTLLELMVVISVIGLLAAIAVPLYSQYLQNAIEGRVLSDLRHVAVAEEAYFVDYQVFRDCDESNCATLLPGIDSLSGGVTLNIVTSGTSFTGTASHPGITTTCHWSNSLGGLLGCY